MRIVPGMGGLGDIVGRVEEALLARTLMGRRLVADVVDDAGAPLFPAGREIDQAMLDVARERGILERLADSAEPGTSDSEIEELLSWRKHRHDADHHAD